MRLVDTHCHLNLEQYAADIQQVIEEATSSGIERIVIPAIDIPGSRSAIALAEKHPSLYAAIGIHPNEGWQWDSNSRTTLIELAKHPKVVAIGEIGLDNHWKDCPSAIQKKIFEEQLMIAQETNLPVIIHSRESLEDVFNILSNWKTSKPVSTQQKWQGVLHAFEGELDESKQAINSGFLIGLGGPITYKNAIEKQVLVANLAMDNFVLETDAPYLTPLPHRGKRNHPKYINIIAKKIAQIKNIKIELLAQATTKNAKDLFAWET